ncbi:hypothetical protein AAFC00_000299 [Neodothiora populina]|uniref:Peroxin-3 n=1 Tax=Neodothiora populina TaxID=2781224 RepID=A0ABR3PCF1_9PEZI
MFAATRRWFRRNRTPLAVGAGTLGAVYLAGQYAWGKWLEARQRMSEERIAKDNLRRRFEQNQEDCTYTVLALLPTFREEIIAALPAEDITAELQRQKQDRLTRSAGASEAASSEFPSAPASTIEDDRGSLASFQSSVYVHASQMAESSGSASQTRSKRSKMQLWNDLKIQSITRALSLLYILSLLTLLTRIQLNLLGRRTYLSSVVSLASPRAATQSSQISLQDNDDNYDDVYGNDFETNRKYLTFSWWLLHRGSKDVMQRVQTAVEEVFGAVNPREDITLERLSHLILDVRKRVEGSTETERRQHKWLAYLLPPRDQEDYVLQESGMNTDTLPSAPQLQSTDSSPSLRRLIDETSDLIDSPTFTHVLTLLLNTTFSHLIDQRVAAEAFKIKPTSATNRIAELDAKCKIAQTLAVFCRQAHVIAAGSSEPDDLAAVAAEAGSANEYLANIDAVKDLEGFAAVIYSSNFEFEAVDETGDAAEGVRAATTAASTTLSSDPVDSASFAPLQEQQEPKPDITSFDSVWEKALAKEDGEK